MKKSIPISEKKLPFLELIFIVFLFAIYLLPSAAIGTMTLLALIFVYCLYLIFEGKKLSSMVVKTLSLIFMIALFYALLTDATSIGEDVAYRDLKRFASKVFQYLSLYFPAILFVRVSEGASHRQKKALSVIGIAMMLYVVVTTWTYLIENPDATREWSNFAEISSQGVASYYFIYAIPIIISAVLIIFMRSKGPAKFFALMLVALGLLFLVAAQYTLAILIAIIGILIQFFRTLRRGTSKVVFVLIVALFALFFPQMLSFAISVIPSQQVSIRLGEIYTFLTGGGAGGYNLRGRLTLYAETIKAFLLSPIWGNRTLKIDGHATFLTVLADTGLLGGFPFYLLLFVICKSIKRELRASRQQFGAIITMFVLMGLTNPIHASFPLGLTTWFLAPLTIELILKEENTNEITVEN